MIWRLFLCIDLGNNNWKYCAILTLSSILLTYIMVLDMFNIFLVWNSNISSLLKPFFWISLTIQVIFGQSKNCLYNWTNVCKCRLLQIYFKTLRIIVANSTIIRTSEKKIRNFLIFAYFFQNSCQFYSKCTLIIAIHIR